MEFDALVVPTITIYGLGWEGESARGRRNILTIDLIGKGNQRYKDGI